MHLLAPLSSWGDAHQWTNNSSSHNQPSRRLLVPEGSNCPEALVLPRGGVSCFHSCSLNISWSLGRYTPWGATLVPWKIMSFVSVANSVAPGALRERDVFWRSKCRSKSRGLKGARLLSTVWSGASRNHREAWHVNEQLLFLYFNSSTRTKGDLVTGFDADCSS